MYTHKLYHHYHNSIYGSRNGEIICRVKKFIYFQDFDIVLYTLHTLSISPKASKKNAEHWTMQGTEGLVQLRAVCPSEFGERQEAPGSGGGDKGV